MGWIAKKPFFYRGKRYQVGDSVPAEGWKTRSGLIKLKRIAQVPDESTEAAEEVSTPTVNLSELKRDALNEYALTHGIDDPTSYSKKEDLVKALEELESTETEETDEPPAASVENDPEDKLEEEDDLFPNDDPDENT